MAIWGVIALIVQVARLLPRAHSGAGPVAAHRERRDRARDLARRRVGHGRHAQRRLDGHVTRDETLRPGRSRADGRDRHDGGRRLHDAAAPGVPAAGRIARRAARRGADAGRAPRRRTSRAGAARWGGWRWGSGSYSSYSLAAASDPPRPPTSVSTALRPSGSRSRHRPAPARPAQRRRPRAAASARPARSIRRSLEQLTLDMLNAGLARARNFAAPS